MFFYKKKGFTMIEIFIAISVLAVVTAVSFYYYNDYVEDARKAVRISNEKIVNDAIARYYKEHMAYPKYEWKKDSIEDLGKKINRGLDSALSNYFINKNVSDYLLEASGSSGYDVYFLVSEPTKRGLAANVDHSTATETWKMAKNLRIETKDYLVHEIRIAEPDSGITTSTFNNHERFNFPLITNSTPIETIGSGYSSVTLDEELDIKMIAIPPGTFIMGSPTNELGRNNTNPNERQHKVTITKQFLISKYEVTQKQFLKVMGINPSHNTTNEFYPVENITFNEAKEFCNILNRDYSRLIPYGYKFDLPTEAQWEYACRAGTTTALNNGKNLTSETADCPNLAEVAWYKNNSGNTTHQVGLKKPNAWGLYDMHGNVLEFCLDKRGDWKIDYSPDDVVDPLSTTGHEQIIRGGSYLSETKRNRSAYRDGKTPTKREFFAGLRVVLIPIE